MPGGGVFRFRWHYEKNCQGVKVQVQVARCKTFFGIWQLFLILNLKILPIWFSYVSRCHLKDFFHKVFKTGLTFWNSYVVLKNRKLSSNVSPYRWDTLYPTVWVGNKRTIQYNMSCSPHVFTKRSTIAIVLIKINM